MASHGKSSLLDGIDGSSAPRSPGTPAAGGANAAARKNKIIAVVCSVALIALAVYIVSGFLGGESAASASESRTLVDAETGEVFEKFRIPDGKSFPYAHPKTGRNTLYPAEPCFWAKDGSIKEKPTWVLLNQYAGKEGQTICPDCGKPVRSHNPYPVIK